LNNTLIQQWQSLANKFEALNKRERWLVASASFVLVYAIINSLLISPVLSRQKSLNNELVANQSQIQTLKQQIALYAQQSVIDPDAKNKQRIAELQANLQMLETQLNRLQTSLISPEKMPELLRSLLKKNGKLQLIELKTLAIEGLPEGESLNTNANSSSTAMLSNKQDAVMFKHGIELTIEGRYLDLLEYVSNLEKMPWHVLWSKAELNSAARNDGELPSSQLKLTVYTLSLDQTWLSI
jgi:MSHA biogenesis protein MshJ